MSGNPLTSSEQIRSFLGALGEKMAYYRCEPVGLVVCGGAALSVAGIISRPTRDVDIVAIVEAAVSGTAGLPSLSPADVLPEGLRMCAREVAADFGLPGNWLNTGPRELFRKGLPVGIEQRLSCDDLGPGLRVYWLGRQDLISLKLYAASDDRGGRQNTHEEDLRRLAPEFSEAEAAVDWMRTLDDYDVKSVALKRLLINLGLNDVAYYV